MWAIEIPSVGNSLMCRAILPANALTGPIDEKVHLVEAGLLGMSMQRPFISDEASFRAGFDAYVYLFTSRFVDNLEFGVIMTSNTRYSDGAADGRRRGGSTRRSQQANRVQTRLRNHPIMRG
jgi:hypothetical protein